MAKARRRFLVEVDGTEIDLRVGMGQVEIGDRVLPYVLHDLSGGWYHLVLDGMSHSMYLPARAGHDGRFEAAVNGKVASVIVRNERDLLIERFGLAGPGGPADREVRAPMPGLVLRTLVEAGHSVRTGDGLLVLEAMKMENEIRSSTDGVVKLVHVAAGDAVTKNDLLLELE